VAFLWFIVAVVFFVLWLTGRSAKKQDSNEYQRGFREGFASLAEAIKDELAKPKLNRRSLQEKVSQHDASPVVDFYEDTSREEYDDEPFLGSDTMGKNARTIVARKSLTKKQKAAVTNRNLNVLLYTASFLIVAAAAAFVATTFSATIRISGVWLVTLGFYGAGFILYNKVKYLRPAALAFIGTGLALVPFAGFALANLTDLSYGWAWCITSVIGLFAYAFAAFRLKNNVVAYLTIAFALSFAASTIATLSGPMVLYFVILILVSLLFHLLAKSNASWIPALFKQPITFTGHVLAPLTLLGSVAAVGSLTIENYQLIAWVLTLYYTVLWVTERRYLYETAVRVLVSLALFITSVQASQFDPVSSMTTLLVILSAQTLYSVARVRLNSALSRTRETMWYCALLTITAVTSVYWLPTNIAAYGMTLTFVAISLLSVVATLRFRRVYYAIPALVGSLIIPFFYAWWLMVPHLNNQLLMSVFAAAATLTIMLLSTYREVRSYAVRVFLEVAFWLYLAMALFVSIGQRLPIDFTLSSLVFALIILLASYTLRRWWVELLTTPFVVALWYGFYQATAAPHEWLYFLTIFSAALVFACAVLLHHRYAEWQRRDGFVIATLVVGAGLVFTFASSHTVVAMSVTLMLIAGLASLIARSVIKNRVLIGAFSISYAAYPLIAIILSLQLGFEWLMLSTAVTALTYYIASYVEKQPVMMLFGNAALIATTGLGWYVLKLDTAWFYFGVAWITGVLFYLSYIFYVRRKETVHAWLQLASTWTVWGVVTLGAIGTAGQFAVAASWTLLAIALTVGIHGAIRRDNGWIEAALYGGTFAVQRLIGLTAPDVPAIGYAHWWALILILVTVWRRDGATQLRLIIATGFITFSTGFMALTDGGIYQAVFLLEHVALLVIGALTRTSWALWWGLVATVLAVLYFLRSSLFLSLLFLGLTLLGIVIWRLRLAAKKNEKH
jgi:hypothetical protein